MTDSVCIYCGAIADDGHSAYDCIQVLKARVEELSSAAPQRHPASDPPRHPNWVIVCIKGDIFPAVYVHGEWMEWWGEHEPLPTPNGGVSCRIVLITIKTGARDETD